MRDTPRICGATDTSGQRRPGDTIIVHLTHDAAPSTGLRQAVLRCTPGVSAPRSPGAGRSEVLFVSAGVGELRLNDIAHPLHPEIAAYITPDETYQITTGAEGLEIVSVSGFHDADATCGTRRVTLDLAEQIARDAVSHREYRLLFGPQTGCASLTQFVGYIPPIRTPLHYHDYSEMIYVLSGRGRVEIAGTVHPISPGSCLYLPAGCPHLVENLGGGYLRLLGVFTPAGSPDVAHPVTSTPQG